MRCLVSIFLLLGLVFKTDGRDILQNDFVIDSSKTTKDKKPLLIGNVTELSAGYILLYSNPFYNDSVVDFKSSNTNSFCLSQYFIINNYVFQTGIEYSIATTDFSIDYYWDTVYTSQILVNDTIGVHYYISNGDSLPEYIIDQYYTTQTNTDEKSILYKSISKSHCLTIPVNVGYRWRYEKFALYAKVGARFSFITQTTGKIFLASNKEWVQLDKKIENKFYFSASASVAFEYPFSSLCSLILEPEYRYNWYSRVNSSFAENNHQFGMKLGIQFWF